MQNNTKIKIERRLNRGLSPLKNEKLRTNKLSISFSTNAIDSIEIFNGSSGAVANLEQHLKYIPKQGYYIKSIQKATLSNEHVLIVEVKFEY